MKRPRRPRIFDRPRGAANYLHARRVSVRHVLARIREAEAAGVKRWQDARNARR